MDRWSLVIDRLPTRKERDYATLIPKTCSNYVHKEVKVVTTNKGLKTAIRRTR